MLLVNTDAPELDRFVLLSTGPRSLIVRAYARERYQTMDCMSRGSGSISRAMTKDEALPPERRAEMKARVVPKRYACLVLTGDARLMQAKREHSINSWQLSIVFVAAERSPRSANGPRNASHGQKCIFPFVDSGSSCMRFACSYTMVLSSFTSQAYLRNSL